MFPCYSDTSTHNDVLLSLDSYGSATCCFNDTHVIALSQDHQALHSQNYCKVICNSLETGEAKFIR